MIRVYSETFLNSKDLDSSVLDEMRNDLVIMSEKIKKIAKLERDSVARCLGAKLIPPMEEFTELIRDLASLQADHLPERSELSEMFKKFKGEMARMSNNLTKSQTIAFQHELISDLYRKPIVKMGKFVFHRKSELFYDLRSNGTVNFEIIFPFEDSNLQAEKDCVSLDSLPKFYKSKDFRQTE